MVDTFRVCMKNHCAVFIIHPDSKTLFIILFKLLDSFLVVDLKLIGNGRYYLCGHKQPQQCKKKHHNFVKSKIPPINKGFNVLSMYP